MLSETGSPNNPTAQEVNANEKVHSKLIGNTQVILYHLPNAQAQQKQKIGCKTFKNKETVIGLVIDKQSSYYKFPTQLSTTRYSAFNY